MERSWFGPELRRTAFKRRVGSLHFINMSPQLLEKLTTEFGTPLYVYNAAIIRARILELKTELGQYSDTEILYAVKANYNPHLVQLIVENGCGVDAVSPEEALIGLVAGAKPEQIMFTENNATDAEIDVVMSKNILVNAGSLSRLEKIGTKYPGSKVCVRFNPNVGAASHSTNITGGPDSKFGISYAEIDKVKNIVTKYNLQVVGVHEHIGSGWLGLDEPLLALDMILDIAKQFPDLEFVDVGGGVGVPYRPDQTRLDLKVLGARMAEKFSAFCQTYGRNLKLRFEPGRYIVAEGGQLIARVNTLKQKMNGKNVIGVDTGMNHLIRPALYDSYHPIVNLSNPTGTEQIYDVTGNICESADYFAKDRALPEVREGDLISFEIAGAYGQAMASTYQFRAKPAEILVEGDQISLIRPRETFASLLAAYPDFKPTV